MQYKLGMRTLAAAVNIITSTHSGHRYGMTATAVCSVTADPPTLLVCINKATTTHNAISKSGVFCVNTLRAEDWELSTTFSGAQSGEGRFKSRDWTHLATGSPALIDALVSFDCRLVKKDRARLAHHLSWDRWSRCCSARRASPCCTVDGQYAKIAALSHGEPLPEGLDYWGY